MNQNNLTSYPSLSNSLNTLPNATSMSNIPLHANMYAKYAQESEAKLQKALSSKSGHSSSNYPSASYRAPTSPSDSATLMMRKPQKK